MRGLSFSIHQMALSSCKAAYHPAECNLVFVSPGKPLVLGLAAAGKEGFLILTVYFCHCPSATLPVGCDIQLQPFLPTPS